MDAPTWEDTQPLNADVSPQPSGVPPSTPVPTQLDASQPQSSEAEAIPTWEGTEDLQEKYGGLGQQAITGLEGAAQGVIGPLAPLAEKALGVPEADILARQKANPFTHGIGETAGLVGSMMTGVGEAALVGKVGLAGAAKIGLRAEKVIQEARLAAKEAGLGADATKAAVNAAKAEFTMGQRIGSAAATAAIENGLIQGSDEVSKMILHDPEQSAQTVITSMLLSPAIGGAVGGALKGVGELWNATLGGKGNQFLEDFKGRVKYHVDNPDPAKAVHEELTNLFENVGKHADEVYGAQGLKARDIAASIPEMNEKIANQANEIGKRFESSLGKLAETEDPHIKLMQREYNNFQRAVTDPSATSSDIFDAIQTAKQQFQEWGKFNKDMVPLGEREFRNAAKEFAYELRQTLEDESVWGKAAERQKDINKAFSEYLPTLKDMKTRFTTKIGGENVIDAGKVQTYINQLGKSSADIKQSVIKNFLDKSEAYLSAIDRSRANLGAAPAERTSLAAIKSTLSDITPGAKLADYVVRKGAANLGGEAVGVGIGAAMGHATGHTGIGALIGEHALAPFFSHILPSIVRPMVDFASNSAGFKAAVDYATQVVKGENLTAKATANIFKAGREVLPQALMPTEKDRNKLDKQLKDLKTSPEKLLNNPPAAGHYYPDHGVALSKTVSNVVNYLNGIRPSTDKQSPLDTKPVINPVQKALYDRALNIAQQPLSVLDHVKKGTVTPQDVAGLQAMYPALYVKLCKQLTNNLMDHIAKGNTVEYNTRLGVSLFTGQALDSTMLPQSIMAAQPMPQQQPNATTQGQQVKHSTGGLTKLPQQYMTPGQKREQANQTK